MYMVVLVLVLFWTDLVSVVQSAMVCTCSTYQKWWLELRIQCLQKWWLTSKWTLFVMASRTFTLMLMEAIHMQSVSTFTVTVFR